MRRFAPLSAASFVLVSFVSAKPSSGPVAVSPGSATGDSIAPRCATFSWGRLEGAVAYELAVYRIDADGEVEAEPSLSQRIPGSALGWTPSLDRCPQRGERYAWSVRAITEAGVSEWSAPLLFEVEERLSEEELAWAFEVLRRRVSEQRPDAENGAVDRWEHTDAIDSVGSPPERRGEARGSEGVHEPGAGSIPKVRSGALVAAGNPSAHIKVAGEVRTIDPDAPTGPARLWGRGRVDGQVHGLVGGPCTNGTIKYGLSTVAVDWGSAADACPAGTWVCRFGEIAACDTSRPDDFGLTCDNELVHFDPNSHSGWLADRGVGFLAALSGRAFSETGTSIDSAATCLSFPVWCCWK